MRSPYPDTWLTHTVEHDDGMCETRWGRWRWLWTQALYVCGMPCVGVAAGTADIICRAIKFRQ